MSSIDLPLSGAVSQTLLPWTNFFTVNVGESSNPGIERGALSIASYGKQIGRIEDALNVIVRHLPDKLALSPDEHRAISDFKAMLYEIDKLKADRHVQHIVWPKLG